MPWLTVSGGYDKGRNLRNEQKEACNMLDFEEELKKFQPSLEVEDIEKAIYQEDLTDMTDILREVMEQAK